MTNLKTFAIAFWRAMGDRENNLKAIREAAVILAVLAYLLGMVAFAQAAG